MQDDFYKRAADLMQRLVFMVVASASKAGNACVTPVFYAFDDDLNFYWLSAPDAAHSRNIDENGAVEIVIFDSTRGDWDGFGLYFAGQAHRLGVDDEKALKIAHETSYKRAGKAARDALMFTGDFPRHYYKFSPQNVWTNGVEMRFGGRGSDGGGVPVDVREGLDLERLKAALLGY